MKSTSRLWLLAAAAALSGCNVVMTEKPLITAADAGSAPPIRAGVWRTEKADCVFDETLPQDQWPECAHASPGVGESPAWRVAAGDPELLQTPPINIPFGEATKPFYLYIAIRPLKLDAQGRIIVMKTWTVRCGPAPTPDPEVAASQARLEATEARFASELRASQASASPGIYSPTDPSSVTRLGAPENVQAPEPDDAETSELNAKLAKLSADSKRISASLARMQPTKAPLPGLTMNPMGGCSAASAEALRNAARVSEAWADDDPVSHWVRERKAGDKPALTAEALAGMGPGK